MHFINNFLGFLCQFAHGFDFREVIVWLQKWRIKQFGKHDEIRLIAAQRIDKKFNLFVKSGHIGKKPHFHRTKPKRIVMAERAEASNP